MARKKTVAETPPQLPKSMYMAEVVNIEMKCYEVSEGLPDNIEVELWCWAVVNVRFTHDDKVHEREASQLFSNPMQAAVYLQTFCKGQSEFRKVIYNNIHNTAYVYPVLEYEESDMKPFNKFPPKKKKKEK